MTKNVQEILEDLNWWAEKGGDPDHRPANHKSSGGSNAAVERYKKELDKLGVKYKWENGKYVLVEKDE